MTDQATTTIRQLLQSLTVPQAWTIAGAAVAMIAGSFIFGTVIQGGRDDSTISSKDREIGSLTASTASTKLANDQAIADLQTKNRDLTRTIDVLKSSLQSTLAERGMFEGKAEFLHRFVDYLQTHSEISKGLLVGVVCTMWKDSEKRRIQFQRQPVDLDLFMNPRVSSQDSDKLLSESGVPADVIARINHPENFVSGVFSPPFRVSRGPSEAAIIRSDAITVAQKQIQGVEVVKIITFFDGMQYRMPEEIAIAVHTKPECSPT